MTSNETAVKGIKALIQTYQTNVKEIENTHHFGRCGRDDNGFKHGERDCLDTVIEDLETLLGDIER